MSAKVVDKKEKYEKPQSQRTCAAWHEGAVLPAVPDTDPGQDRPTSVSNREEARNLAKDGLQELNDALRDGRSETLNRYLDFVAKFHNYSFGNSMLIALQRPDATHVAGYNRWHELGRQVRKGEKGIAIYAPMTRVREVEPREEETVSDAEPKKVPVVTGFKVAYVFDISQTEGDAIPEFARVAGDPEEKLSDLERLIIRNDIEFRYETPGGGAQGVSRGGVIVVDPKLSPAERFSIAVHELSHEILHKGERRHETTKTVRETEAEAVSYCVCRAFGLDVGTRSSDYIQLYRGDVELLQESLEHIQKTAAYIIEELKADSAPPSTEPPRQLSPQHSERLAAVDAVSTFRDQPIYSYSRAQALDDGVLVDVSGMAREAGLKYPTALTQAVFERFVAVPPELHGLQDQQGRLWDILTSLRHAASHSGPSASQLTFGLRVQNDNRAPQPVTLKAVCAPGDNPQPVITVMLPDED